MEVSVVRCSGGVLWEAGGVMELGKFFRGGV